jgi:prevent-host-death family protein
MLTYIVYTASMKTITVAELKANFSKFMKDVQKGAEIVIAFGRKKEKIAVIVPYDAYIQRKQRRLGSLQHCGILLMQDFSMSDEELLQS